MCVCVRVSNYPSRISSLCVVIKKQIHTATEAATANNKCCGPSTDGPLTPREGEKVGTVKPDDTFLLHTS